MKKSPSAMVEFWKQATEARAVLVVAQLREEKATHANVPIADIRTLVMSGEGNFGQADAPPKKMVTMGPLVRKVIIRPGKMRFVS